MRVSDFDYELPADRIAQEPLADRQASRLMLVDRRDGSIEHHRFGDLPSLLAGGDLLVVNDTRVIPARLIGRKPTGGRVEVLLVERAGGADTSPRWRCLLRASHPPAAGTRLIFDDVLAAEVVSRRDDGWIVRLEASDGDPAAAAERLGQVPLPPYIVRRADDPRCIADRQSYQTVYARRPGAVAAPTAGLHFTEGLLAALQRAGICLSRLTLHVGPGTFQPVRVEQVERHRIHDEAFDLPPETAAAVARAKHTGRRVVAVGTTVVRTLEHRALEDGTVEPGTGRCGLFIYPGFRFRVVDTLITNFHLPRSTLLMLVSAFAGRETILAAYREAVRERYRFYSYGDAMMIRSR